MRFKNSKVEDFGIKIIGIGNLNVGGSGKTPLVIALASEYENIAIILRGYGRKSKGLFIVKNRDKILCNVSISGDEAMIYAHKLPNAVVIVSEDRKEAILEAKKMGSKLIFLDDAYSKHSIKKLDIIIDVNSENSRCLPAGPFRERLWSSKNVIVLKDGEDFTRVVDLKYETKKMSLVTAIARPQRLDKFLPYVVSKNYFADHYSFTKDELITIMKKNNSTSLLVTYKDYVKVVDFNIPLSLLDLHIKVQPEVFNLINSYIYPTSR